MSPYDKNWLDRRQVPEDEKNRALILRDMNLVPPEGVGICDPPLRFYPLNNEWAKIVMGLVSWLATIAPWRDAEDETYTGIQEVLTFMIGCDPCEALAYCLQGIVDTPYSDLTDALKAIYDALKQIEKTQGTPSQPTTYQDNPVLLAEGPGCDPDHLYAAMLGLVDFANLAITEILQDITAATAGLETVAEVISAIPIFGLLPFDEIVALADQFLDGLYANYLSAYSEVLRREFACDLFCIAKDNCGLFFVQAFDYFAERATLSIADTDLEDVIEFLTEGIFSGNEYVYAAHALFFFVLAFGGDWGKYSADFMAKEVASKFNDSDPDWVIFCGCAWEETINTDDNYVNYNLIEGEPYLTGVRGVQVGLDRRLTFEIPFSVASDVTKIICTGRFDQVANQRVLRVRGFLSGGMVFDESKSLPGYTTGNHDYEFDIGEELDLIEVVWFITQNDTTGFGFNLKCELSGSGDNPFE